MKVFSVCGLDRCVNCVSHGLSVLGHFVAHPKCCARITGARQTFTVHVSSPLDDRFISLPRLPPAPLVTKQTPISHYCSSCKRGYSDDDPVSSALYASVGGYFLCFGLFRPFCWKIYSAVPLTPAAEFVNSLNITGCLTAKARGKELIIAICNATTGANVSRNRTITVFAFIWEILFISASDTLSCRLLHGGSLLLDAYQGVPRHNLADTGSAR